MTEATAASAATATPSRTFIPFPDWGPSQRQQTTPGLSSPDHLGPTANYQEGFPVLQQRGGSTSLLAPASANDALERFLGTTARDGHDANASAGGCVHNDNDSLSASDLDEDDETFFLAAPSAIQEEKQAAAAASNNSNKQRKLARSSMPSNTSLRGMDFVTSSASLRGMDKDGAGSSGRLLSANSSGSLQRSSSILNNSSNNNNNGGSSSDCIKRQESQSSIGLTLEAAASSSSAAAASHNTEESQQGEDRERDLVTPPAMALPPKSPPILSPRYNLRSDRSSDDDMGPAVPASPARRHVQYHYRPQSHLLPPSAADHYDSPGPTPPY